ncbi:anaphase-promoting complex subunit 11 isoform X3 [Haemorhous mexicanus]|uniref:anaphase-promoting complex subunit 11 isoform X3 n=1 Tax=Haemorhous mexicanus TaxID=30427 RepID=UPI0028BD503B|nr:anaphase-promoting complex subunit 11 isoform X3 [Haemorhous mexicanus]
MRVRVRSWHGVASWLWVANDENCGICRMAFNGCCPDCAAALPHVPPGVEVPRVRAAPGTGRDPPPAGPGPPSKCATPVACLCPVLRARGRCSRGGRGGTPARVPLPRRHRARCSRCAAPPSPVPADGPAPPLPAGQDLGAALRSAPLASSDTGGSAEPDLRC